MQKVKSVFFYDTFLRSQRGNWAFRGHLESMKCQNDALLIDKRFSKQNKNPGICLANFFGSPAVFAL